LFKKLKNIRKLQRIGNRKEWMRVLVVEGWKINEKKKRR